MRKLDGDIRRIIESYKYDKEKEINKLIQKRKDEIIKFADEYVEEQARLYLDFDKAMENVRKRFKGIIKVNYCFEVSNYGSDYYPLYDEDEVLRGLNDSLAKINEEHKNIILVLQFADAKSKEYKEALKN